jgi:hypothetical protein
MKRYLDANLYQPVREEDLFGAFDDALIEAGEVQLPGSLGELMTPWTNQAGFPVVTFVRGPSSGGTTTFTVTQVQYSKPLWQLGSRKKIIKKITGKGTVQLFSSKDMKDCL